MDTLALEVRALTESLRARRIVDLSQLLAEELPTTWPGHMFFQHKIWNWFATVEAVWGQKIRGESPYQTRYIILDEHASTHFDAPTHYIPPPDSGLRLAGELGKESGDKVPLDDLQGPCAVIKVTHMTSDVPGESPYVTAEDVRSWEAQHGNLEAGDVVLLHTGWDRYFVEGEEGLKHLVRPLVLKDFPGWAAPSVDLIMYLLERGVKTLGIDAPSIGAVQDRRPAHEAGLSRGIRYVEGLTNLGQLPPRGGYFVFLPLKIKNSTGGPGRAIAYI